MARFALRGGISFDFAAAERFKHVMTSLMASFRSYYAPSS